MILQLQNISKTYPGVRALQEVSLEIAEGEVHALVGENGAGKSTLIKTCTGAVVPDSGKIVVAGQAYAHMTPKLAKSLGIAAIYQEFNLVGELSVAENIFLGKAIRRGIMVDKKRMEQATREIFAQLNVAIDPRRPVKELTVGYQQIVEIAKAVADQARVLIMDEPSAPLTNAETEGMFALVDKLKASGVTIVYISHRLHEIFRLSDRVTVLRDGKKIETLQTAETNIEHLVTTMVGRELKEVFPTRNTAVSGEVLLQTEHVSGNGVTDISFALRKGEVLGLAGLIGSGRTQLAEIIFGVRPKTAGRIVFKGREITPKTPQAAIRQGIALVPEDRKRQGALLDIDIQGNISMAILKRISSCSVVKQQQEKRIAQEYQQSLRIKTPTLGQLVRNLSGGNQQKVVVAKWLATQPDLIILDEPTRGIDVGAKYEIYKLINELVLAGKTILLISSEMEELMGMADRILVLCEGRLTGELQRQEFSQKSIMNYASKNQVGESR